MSTDVPAASKCGRYRKDGAMKIVRNSYSFPVGEAFNQSMLWPRKVFCKSFCSWVGKHVSIGWKMQGLLFLARIESSSKSFVPLNQRILQDNTMKVWCTNLTAPFLYNWITCLAPLLDFQAKCGCVSISILLKSLTLQKMLASILPVVVFFNCSKWCLEIVWQCAGLRPCQAQSNMKWSKSNALEHSLSLLSSLI